MIKPQLDMSAVLTAAVDALEASATDFSREYIYESLTAILDALDAGGPLVGLVEARDRLTRKADGTLSVPLGERLFALRYDLCELDMYRLLYGPLPGDMRPPPSVIPLGR